MCIRSCRRGRGLNQIVTCELVISDNGRDRAPGSAAHATTQCKAAAYSVAPLIIPQLGRWTVDAATGSQYMMQDDAFEWDNEKAASNWRDHGVTFETAREAFKDPFAVEWFDDRQGSAEERYAMLGVAEERLFFVAYALERGENSHHLSTESRTS